jgi:hypothetical protein
MLLPFYAPINRKGDIESPPPPETPLTAVVTNAVVAICVVLVAAFAVGAVGVPVSAGEAKFALRSSAVCCTVETGLAVSAVLSTEPRPTIVFVMPETLPVKVGLANVA